MAQRFRSDFGLYVLLHLLVTDGTFEERTGSPRPDEKGCDEAKIYSGPNTVM